MAEDKRGNLTGGGVPTVSYSPTETTIPPSLYAAVPNLRLYKKLAAAERDVDLLILRKALEFQAVQQKTVHPASVRGEAGLLRVFVYNTCENQPWQKQLGSSASGSVGGAVGGNIGGVGGPPGSNAGDPTWTLRVEGRFIGENAGDAKFSSFLSAVSVDLLPNDDYPGLQGAPLNIVEWRAGAGVGGPNAAFDGIDIKRSGIFNIKARIALLVRSNAHTLRLSPQMTRFAAKNEATQQEVVYLVWQYVLHKNLLKPIANTPVQAVPAGPVGAAPTAGGDADDDLLAVQCDDVLRLLLNTDTFKFVDLYKLLLVHFLPREPVVLDYEVNTRVSTTLGGLVIDIPVDLPAQILNVQQELLEFNKNAFESLTRADVTIQKLNARISLGISALQNAKAREEFYRELADDPVAFIEAWLESQTATLKALKNDEGYDEEVVRRAEYFEENEGLIRDKIELLLGAGKF